MSSDEGVKVLVGILSVFIMLFVIIAIMSGYYMRTVDFQAMQQTIVTVLVIIVVIVVLVIVLYFVLKWANKKFEEKYGAVETKATKVLTRLGMACVIVLFGSFLTILAAKQWFHFENPAFDEFITILLLASLVGMLFFALLTNVAKIIGYKPPANTP
jgi:NADH:ubiquinone oxidoreductase subunit 2 (subunit N)